MPEGNNFMKKILSLLLSSEENKTHFFKIQKYDEETEKILTDSSLADLCRKKSLTVFLETTENNNVLPDAWRLFTVEKISSLPAETILDPYKLSCSFLTLPGWKVLLYAGKVAGYNDLYFGMPEEKIPLLFEHPEYEKLHIALFPFSSFVTSRFAPYCKWKVLWEYFTGLSAEEPVIKTAYDKNSPLPPDAEELCRQKIYSTIRNIFLYRENGILHVAEGYSGEILSDGTQPYRKRERSDCVMETAAALAVDSLLGGDPEHGKMAQEIISRLCNDPDNTALSPEDPCYSLMQFYENTRTYYTSGNSIAALLLAVTQKEPRYILHTLRMMFAILRVTGTQGYAPHYFIVPDSFKEHNWDHFAGEPFFHPCPHRQAAVWSMFLAAWKVTKYPLFLEKAKLGIYKLMEVYPELKWMNDYSGEPVKMLRPLSFLYRLEKTPEHKEYLERVAAHVESLMDASGAVKASQDHPEDALFPPPRSNEEYGTREASLTQTEKDPCCDLLYTQVFAFAGLHEAYMATGEEKYKRLADKAASFLIRTQTVSEKHKELSGMWMRSFDFETWEYYGSSADRIWGAWCIESGWENAPAAMIFSLRKANKGLFDLLPSDGAWSRYLPRIIEEMSKVYPVNLEAGKRSAALGDDR